MFKVTKEVIFCAAHRLPDYPGPCQNLHGHNYRVLLTLAGESLNKDNLLMDFREIKLACGKWIDENWDHVTLVAKTDEALLNFCKTSGTKYFVTEGAPTAEYLAHYLYEITAGTLLKNIGDGDPKVEVHQVVIYETPTCCAIYQP